MIEQNVPIHFCTDMFCLSLPPMTMWGRLTSLQMHAYIRHRKMTSSMKALVEVVKYEIIGTKQWR